METATQPQCDPAGLSKEMVLGEIELASEPGNEMQAMEAVVGMVAPLHLGGEILERVKTAVAESTMNAMEHGNGFRKEIPVQIRVTTGQNRLVISVCDQGGERESSPADAPDLEAKLAGLQSPRGWGLFLIEHMVDEMQVRREGIYHIVNLIFNLPGKPA